MAKQECQQVGALSVSLLREMFRSLPAWRSTFLDHGIEEIHGPDGLCINLYDLEYLLSQVHRLPPRQAQAIQLFLVGGYKESDVAVMMGVSPTNPIGMYATSGISRLLGMIANGELERFKPESAWLNLNDRPPDPRPVRPVRLADGPRFRRFEEVIREFITTQQVAV